MKPAHVKARLTITDIARAACVSKSTVSLVLNNSSLVKPLTAQKVRTVAEKLGYVYNRSAASLRHGTSNIIGMIVNDLSNSFFVELLVGAERELCTANYTTLLAHTGENLALQEQMLISVREQKIAGLILCPALYTPPALAIMLKKWGLPFVCVMRPFADPLSDFVGADNYQAIKLATQHLIQLGHQHIAFIGRNNINNVSMVRQQGYMDCLAEHDLPVNPAWIIESQISMSGGKAAMHELLSLTRKPTAIVCYNDLVAIGVLNEIHTHGLQAGRDIAVVGSDGVIAAAYCSPPLTTVALHSEKIGELASQTLLKRLQQPDHPPIQHLVQPQLIIRQSCGAGKISDAD